MEKRLRRYLFPNMLAMVGISLYVLADTFFISLTAGADGITALNLSLPVYAVIYALGAMIGIGAATQFQLLRAEGKQEAEEYFFVSLFWNALFGLLLMGIGLVASDAILHLMGADKIILATGSSYLKTVLLCAPFFMLNYTLTSFVRNDGAPKIAMAATLISCLFNVVFDYVLIFPCGLGMFGAALATGLSPVVSMAICLFHFFSKRNTVRVVVKAPSLRSLVRASRLGIAGFVSELSGGVTNLVFNYVLLARVGNVGVAAYGVVANVSLIGVAIFNGIAQGLQPLASEACGEGDTEGQRRICKHSLEIGMICAVLILLTCWILAPAVVDVFNSEGSVEMARYATEGLRLYSIGFLLAVVNIILTGFYSAVDRPRESFLLSILRGAVLITVFAILLPLLLDVVGVWLAFPVSELATLAVALLLIRKQNEKKKPA